jgi:hypothetical protein
MKKRERKKKNHVSNACIRTVTQPDEIKLKSRLLFFLRARTQFVHPGSHDPGRINCVRVRCATVYASREADLPIHTRRLVCEAFSYSVAAGCMRPSATRACGLKLRAYAALSYSCMGGGGGVGLCDR